VQGVKLTTDMHPVLKLEWSYTSAPSICLHNVDREKFIVHFVVPVCSVQNLSQPWPFSVYVPSE
jgi:hypothetical protein